MVWSIPDKQKLETIPSKSLGRIAISFIFILITIIILCTSWYYISHDKNAFFYAFVLCGASVIIFSLLVGWHFFQLGIKLEKNEIIKTENDGLDEIYSRWASEYISIIAHNSIFPNEAQIYNLKRREEINVIGQRVIKFPPDIDYTVLFYELLSPLRYILIPLAEKNKLEIVFSMDKSIDQSVWKYFTMAWRKLGLSGQAIKTPIWMVNDYVTQIDEWLKKSGECFRLIITYKPLVFAVENDKAEVSDGICAWLCAPSTMDEDCQIKEKARIYRAMATNTSTLVKDLTDVMIYQSKTGNIENLWISNYKNQETINQVNRVCGMFNREGKPEQYFSDFIIGKQGRHDIWATISLSLLSSYNKDSVNLIVSEDDSGISLSRVKVQRQYDV